MNAGVSAELAIYCLTDLDSTADWDISILGLSLPHLTLPLPCLHRLDP